MNKIHKDIELNLKKQDRLDTLYCKNRIYHPNYINTLKKSNELITADIHEWYSTKRMLESEAQNLRAVEDIVTSIFSSMKKPMENEAFSEVLFIYKGKTVCHQQQHNIVPATAVLYNEYDEEICLDVEYCTCCKRYILNYISYEQYRNKYGILIGNLMILSTTDWDSEMDLAFASPLKLCGYSVSQSKGLTQATRQYILAKIIYDGIMSKLDVIRYLEHFINLNGSKVENSMALEKWCEDLDFVHSYNINIQPRTLISKVKNIDK